MHGRPHPRHSHQVIPITENRDREPIRVAKCQGSPNCHANTGTNSTAAIESQMRQGVDKRPKMALPTDRRPNQRRWRLTQCLIEGLSQCLNGQRTLGLRLWMPRQQGLRRRRSAISVNQLSNRPIRMDGHTDGGRGWFAAILAPAIVQAMVWRK